MRKPWLKVFKLFGYEIEIIATPIKLREDCHFIIDKIYLDKFDEASILLEEAAKKWGQHEQEILNCKAILRLRKFSKTRKVI